MTDLKLTTLCGSLRDDSLNRKLTETAIRRFGAASVHRGDLRLPLYDGDLESRDGVPAAVQALAAAIAGADAVIVTTPEYNQSLSGVLKNALDWISRTDGTPWRGKPVAIMSAAAGRAGGARAQYALRLCLTPFQPRLLSGPEVLVGAASSAFDDAGTLTAERASKALDALMAALRAEAMR